MRKSLSIVVLYVIVIFFDGKEYSFHVVLGVEEENGNDFETKVQR
jgi:hypothetical protein